MQQNNNKITPVYLLSGFLGSGKTTLLTHMLERFKSNGLKPAVIMNELGDINLDGQLVDESIPMAEMLSGCICCTMRGDLGLEIHTLIDKYHPDVIIIESTGAANPMETLDGITEASMYQHIELRTVVSVVDGRALLERGRSGKGRTYKLLRDQIRCGTMVVLNKADRLAPEELAEAQQMLRELNAYAPIITAVRCQLEDWEWLNDNTNLNPPAPTHTESGHSDLTQIHSHEHSGGSHHHSDNHDHSHGHVMAVTHYWSGPVHSEQFDALLKRLPDNIYRAKGIVSFTDAASSSRFLFQYAFKESDIMRIDPQGDVKNVAVFIGEHFSKEWILNELKQLENA